MLQKCLRDHFELWQKWSSAVVLGILLRERFSKSCICNNKLYIAKFLKPFVKQLLYNCVLHVNSLLDFARQCVYTGLNHSQLRETSRLVVFCLVMDLLNFYASWAVICNDLCLFCFFWTIKLQILCKHHRRHDGCRPHRSSFQVIFTSICM